MITIIMAITTSLHINMDINLHITQITISLTQKRTLITMIIKINMTMINIMKKIILMIMAKKM